MTTKLTLYYSRNSIASQSCLLLIKILNISIELEDLDLKSEIEHPVNKVPVLVHDDDLILTEPRAILCYLLGYFKPDDSLYPMDLKKRALIDQRLFYDASVVYPSVINIIRPIIFEKKSEIPSIAKDALYAVFKVLEGLLDNSKSEYFAGNELTLADLSLMISVNASVQFGLKIEQFPLVAKWFEGMQKIHGFEAVLENSKNILKLMQDQVKSEKILS